MKKTSILILIALLVFAPKAWAQWNGSGTEADPYQISSTTDWNALASNVNNGNDYSGKFFKLMNNIAYDYTGAANENNYTAIGDLYNDFNGHFDGNNKTVSGVRIYKNTDYQGLFGHIGGEVKNLTLDDAIIAGESRTGGIAGQNNGNVTNCQVTASVTVVSSYDFIGGVVGFNYGTVSQCTSSVTLTKKANNCNAFGAIVGINGSYGTLSDNLAIGATVPAASGDYHGAIVGMNDSGTLERNYYRNCTVAGVVNAIRVGCAGADVTDNNGALSLHTLSLGNGITASAPTINYNGVGYYARTNSVTLACTVLAPVGYHYVYLVDGEAVSGDTFTMPGTDATITTTTAFTLDYEHITSSDSREFYRFNYPSTSVTGEPVLLSAALVFWKSSSMQDSIQAVHLCCHHTFTANSECPSMSVRPVSLEANSFMASSMTGGGGGLYSSVVIMPDYEGFGVSSDRTHPYLAEEVTAHQTVDAMTFGLQVYQHLVDEGSALALSKTWRSFTLGYSQGGAVALATHRYIEQHSLYDELHFRGSLCGDGPYDLITTLQYYLFDNGTSYEVETNHRQGQCTLPVVIPMIMRGMMLSDPYAGSHSLNDYLSQQFLDTGILDWLDSKTMSTDDIAGAWKQQLTNGFTATNGTTYTPEQMAEMFINKSSSSTPMVWAKLSKVFTPGFYAYLTDASNFNSVPTATGDPYQDMHRALANNGLCTGWNPNHRIQFKHSKQDMVVPYGNYLAYKDAHDGEGTRYRVDNSFSTGDHQAAGTLFFFNLSRWNDVFQWLDGSPLEWSGSGTEADPYMINNTDEWQLLVDSVSAGNTYSGTFFRLGNDISVTTMVGISGKTFNGIFDGNGHTLTVNYTTTAEYCGPFCYTYGATIKNLRTTGTINTSNIRAGGVVGRNGTGNLTMTDVTSNVTINSTYNGSAQHGGLVGYTINADLTGCAFTGSLLGENSNGCGGLIGWKTNTDNSRVNITNCFFAPTNVTVGTANAYTLVKNSSGGVVNVINSYYTQPLGTIQGKQAHSIIGAENVIVTFAGEATEYNVSGINTNGVGLAYLSTLYAGQSDNVSLNLTASDGYVIGTGAATYTPEGGTATEIEPVEGVYSFTMPDANVTINATLTPDVTQMVVLGAGWNWFSPYVKVDNPIELLQMLKVGLGENAEMILSMDDGLTAFDGEDWFGDLDDVGLANTQMYMILTNAACIVEMEGEPVNLTDYEISIKPGWNWIGFPSVEALDVVDAFVGFAAEEGDILLSQDSGLTSYDGEEWFGDLETLEPGVGLMYYSSSTETKTLVYSTAAKGKGSAHLGKRK